MSIMPNTNKRSNLIDLAKMADVSISTVSRVLNNKDSRIKISDKKQQEIRRLAEEYDYSPNIHARRLSTKRCQTIGLSVLLRKVTTKDSLLQSGAFLEMLEGVEQAIGTSDYFLLLMFQNERYFKEKLYSNMLKEQVISGLIVWGSTLRDDYLKSVVNENCIIINSYPQIDCEFNYIGNTENEAFGHLVEYFIKKGHRRFVYVGECGVFNSVGMERVNGFRRILTQYSLDSSRIYQCHFDREQAFAIFDKILSESKIDFDVVAAASDDLAIGVFQAAQKHGYRIPGDFIIAGAGDMGLDFPDSSKIPTFRVNNWRIGELAVQKTLEKLSQKSSEKIHIELPCELVIPDEYK